MNRREFIGTLIAGPAAIAEAERMDGAPSLEWLGAPEPDVGYVQVKGFRAYRNMNLKFQEWEPCEVP